MDLYSRADVIPLSFSRVRNNALISGLTVTVIVVNAKTNATLLASTSVPEVLTSGIYTYNWAHGILADTECLVTYTAGISKYNEFIMISNNATGGITA